MSVGDSIQLSPGFFQRSETAVEKGAVKLRQFVYNVGVRVTIDTRDKLVLAYVPRQSGIARLNGELWLNQRVAVIRGTAHISATRAFVLTVAEFDVGRVPIFAATIGAQALAGEWSGILQANDPAGLRLQARVEETLADSASGDAALSIAERRLVASFVQVVASALASSHRTSRHARSRSVAGAAERYMWAHIEDEIGLKEICRGIGCHARSLINHFHALYGMSPVRFLKILRLNAARKALGDGKARRQSIFEVAADHGFWHMGHFSTDYRNLFGQTPSESLHP